MKPETLATEIASIMETLHDKPIWIGHERNEVHDELMRQGVLDFVIDRDTPASEMGAW